jgi:hypothetical protein
MERFNEYRGPNQEMVRVSITIDKAVRRKIRIAAASADMELGDWVTTTLRDAAETAIRAEERRHEEPVVEPGRELAPEVHEAG